ncbi:MAG: trigger factor [Acidimicrobiia bacterium]|nr:trigger factor [Acidimicrobiia bacterium]
METTVTEAGPFEKLVVLHVPEASLEEAKQQTARRLSRSLKIPGFRPGRAPRRVVEATVGTDRLRAEAIDDALPKIVTDALAEAGVEYAALPAVEQVSDVDGGLEIHVKVASWPSLEEPPDYVGRQVEVPSPAVTDDELTEQLDRFREQFADLEEVDRPAAEGDYASIDLSAKDGSGDPIEELDARDLMVALGSTTFIDGLDDALLGLEVGGAAVFEGPLPEGFGDRAGEIVTFSVTVKDIRGRKLPDLTDEWVEETTEFSTVDELRAELLHRMGEAKLGASWTQYRNDLMALLVDEVDLEIPEGIVTHEMENVLHRFNHSLSEQGIEFDDYLRLTDQSQDDFLSDLRSSAGRNVATDLILDAVADDAGLVVEDDEVAAVMAAVSAGEGGEASLSESQVKALRSDILRRKAHDALLKASVPVDETGSPIDFEVLASQYEPDESIGLSEEEE